MMTVVLMPSLIILQWLVRIIGATMLLLGLSFWTGNAFALIPLHMLLGLLFVLLLWSLAALGLRAGVPIGLAIVAFAWGLVVPVLGLTQAGLLPGPFHWVMQVLHLLVGLGAIGLAETLARRARASLVASPLTASA